MATSAQNFNVDLAFLYGTVLVTSGSVDYPAFEAGSTDWNRRAIELPVITKEIENWSGNFNVGQTTFGLADVDGRVTASLYGTNGYPHGKPVAIYEKISDNPIQFMNTFNGLVSSTERESGVFRITCEDSLRNVLNAQFVPDFQCISTFVGTVWYGVVNDVIGSNIYTSDKYSKQLITVKKPGDDWWGAILGGVIGAGLGILSGGALAPILGGASGFISGIPANETDRTTSYYRVTDYNVIPDNVIFGGQPLKFFGGSIDARAHGNSGSLFGVTSVKIKGGTFVYGGEGTIEIDDIFNNVKKYDFIYAQLPLIYRGSPDTILVNILTGSNVTPSYRYPDDFSDEWFEHTETLRHIDAWAIIADFEAGGVIKAIDSLCKEFGFSVYMDEANKFAIRGNRLRSLATSIIGTLDERYNVLNKGFSRKDDIKTSYTDISINFKDSIIKNQYEQTITATLPAATYYGAIRRNLTINSAWMHDRITAEFMATRLSRKYAGIVPTINAEISLFAVPFVLSDLISCTGWSVGTGEPYEITKYTKDYSRSIANIEAESGSYYYKTGFFKVGTLGTKSANSSSGFATTIGSFDSGTNHGISYYKLAPSDNIIFATLTGVGLSNGDLIGFDGYEEIIRVDDAINYDTSVPYVVSGRYSVTRGMFNTCGQVIPINSTIRRVIGTPYATLFDGNPIATSFRWF